MERQPRQRKPCFVPLGCVEDPFVDTWVMPDQVVIQLKDARPNVPIPADGQPGARLNVGLGRVLMHFRSVALLAAALVAVAVPVLAHHASQAEFDKSLPKTVVGVLTRVQWTNPHVRTRGRRRS